MNLEIKSGYSKKSFTEAMQVIFNNKKGKFILSARILIISFKIEFLQ